MTSFPLSFDLKDIVRPDKSVDYHVVLDALKRVKEDGQWPVLPVAYEEFLQLVVRDIEQQIPQAIAYTDQLVEGRNFEEKLINTKLHYEIPTPGDVVLNSLNAVRGGMGKDTHYIPGMFLIS